MNVDRLPPTDDEAEVAVLGAMMLAPEAVQQVRTVVVGEDFYRPAHRILYQHILHVADHTNGGSVDPLVLRARLQDQDHLEHVGGEEYLASVMGAVPSAANCYHYARRVKEVAARRASIRAGQELIRMAYEGLPLHEMRDHVEYTLDQAEGASGAPYTVGNLAALRTKDIPVPAAIIGDRILDAGHLLVMSGDGGSGKSYLVLDLALRLCRLDTPEWLRFSTHGPMRVLVLYGEGGEASLRERAVALTAGREVGKEDGFLYWCPGTEMLDLQNREHLGRLEHTIRTTGAGLLVADPLVELRLGKEDNESFGAMCQGLRQVRARTGCAMILTHHTSKRQEHVPSGHGDRSRGGSVLRDASDTFLVLEEDPADTSRRFLYYSKVRHGPAPRPSIIEMREGGAGFVFVGDKVEGGAPVKLDAARLLEAVHEAGSEGVTVAALRERFECSRATVYRHMDALVESGQVRTWKYGRTAHYGPPVP